MSVVAQAPEGATQAPGKYPYGDGFQLKIIALSLREPQFLTRHVDVFRSEWFERDHLQTLAYIILAYFKKYGSTPTYDAMVASIHEYATAYGREGADALRAALGEWLGHAYQADLRDAQYVSDKMLHFGQRQALKQAIGQTIEKLNQDADTSDVREVFEKALQVGSVRSTGLNFSDVALDLSNYLQSDTIYSKKLKVSSGFPTIDSRSFGGFGAGELIVVAGPPGRGKSTLMVNLGKAAAFHFAAQVGNRKRVVYISLELKEADLALMYGAVLSGVAKNDLILGQRMDHYHTVMAQQMAYLGDRLRFKYFSPGSVGVEDIRWFIANLISFEGVEPGVLLLDYADKLRGGEDDRYRGMGDIYDALIAIGDRFQIPVITGSQINREWAAEEVIDMRGISESWLKAANCDQMITLCQSQAEHEAGIMRLFLAKVRRGAGQGQVLCRHSGDLAYIREMTIEEAKEYETRKVSMATPSPRDKKER